MRIFFTEKKNELKLKQVIPNIFFFLLILYILLDGWHYSSIFYKCWVIYKYVYKKEKMYVKTVNISKKYSFNTNTNKLTYSLYY